MQDSSKNIILVTFDHHRIDYPTMSFSAASILAALKKFNIQASHYSFDIRDFQQTPEGYMPVNVLLDLDGILNYLKGFSIIAVGVTRWSETFAYMLIKKLDDYEGKIVVGGYEITALKEDSEYTKSISRNLNIHHFIQGYAEKPLVKIIQGKYSKEKRFLREDLDENYLASPYSCGVLNTYSRKIYWETKRGCNSKCGFCEWGNTDLGAMSLNTKSIERDIDIFSQSNVEEINILDGTFNVDKQHLDILKKLLQRTNAKITFQARFEYLKPEYIEFYAANKDRLLLEFGLQTIHKKEQDTIGRKNNMPKIKAQLNILNQNNIDFEVSIIYAIPGQTVSSFIDTIEFLRINGCKKIMAFSLQIPRNSELEQKRQEYQIKFRDDVFYVKTVDSSMSFTADERHDMDCIALSLAHEDKAEGVDMEHLIPIKDTQYQYEFTEEYISSKRESLDRIISDSFCRMNNYSDYLKSRENNPLAYAKGVFSTGGTGFLDFALGKKSFATSENKNKGSEIKESYFKTVIGQSGYIYILRDYRVNPSL